jgi:PAS domain S-box-containing protein
MSDTTGGFSPRIVDSLIDAVVVIEDSGRIIYANPALGRLLGRQVHDLFAVPFTDLFPAHLQSDFASEFSSWMASDPPLRSRGPIRLALLHDDGSEVPVDIATFLVAPVEGPRLVIAAVWDVRLRMDIDRYRQVADDLMTFLAEASGETGEVVTELLGIIASSLGFEVATAWRWDDEQELLHCEYTWQAEPHAHDALVGASSGLTARPGEGLAGLVADSDRPRWFGDLATSPHLRRHSVILRDGMRSAFLFPIRTRRHLVGVVELFSESMNRPDRALFDAVAEVGSRLGSFIERLELETHRGTLLVQLEQARTQLAFLLRANLAVVRADSFEEAVRRLGEVAVPTLGDICLIDVVADDGSLERVIARHADPDRQLLTDGLLAHPPDLSGTHPAALAVRTGLPQWSPAVDTEFMTSTTRGTDHLTLTETLGFRTYLSVPLIVDDRSIGAMTVVTTDPDRTFGDRELHLALDLAPQVARAVERARTMDEQSMIARKLQESLLPRGPLRFAGVELAVHYEAFGRGAEVGGDFYDVVPLDGQRVALVIGDVEGHDMTAATVMGQLRSAMRAFFQLHDDPGVVLSLLSAFLARQNVGRFATALVSVLDVTTGAMAIASAGHPPPYVQRAGSLAPMTVTPGPPLGLSTDHYPVDTALVTPADVVILYTDGLIDIGRENAQRLEADLASTLSTLASAPCEQIADMVMRQVAEGDRRVDDGALLVFRTT